MTLSTIYAIPKNAIAHFDRKGQGKPCGKGWISARKKCSKKGAQQLAADLKAGDKGAIARVRAGKQKASDRQKLNRAVEADKGKKARDIPETANKTGQSGSKRRKPNSGKRKAAQKRVATLPDSSVPLDGKNFESWVSEAKSRVSQQVTQANGDRSKFYKGPDDFFASELEGYSISPKTGKPTGVTMWGINRPMSLKKAYAIARQRYQERYGEQKAPERRKDSAVIYAIPKNAIARFDSRQCKPPWTGTLGKCERKKPRIASKALRGKTVGLRPMDEDENEDKMVDEFLRRSNLIDRIEKGLVEDFDLENLEFGSRDHSGKVLAINALNHARDPKYGLVATTDDEGRPVGFLSFRSHPKSLDIKSLGTIGGQKGGGRKLLEKLGRMAIAEGKGLTVESYDDAIGFYKKMGFRKKSTGLGSSLEISFEELRERLGARKDSIYAIPKNAIVRFDARKKAGSATGTPKPCGRGWVGTKPPGCERPKKGASSTTTKKSTKRSAGGAQKIEKLKQKAAAKKVAKAAPDPVTNLDPIAERIKANRGKPIGAQEMIDYRKQIRKGETSADEVRANWERFKNSEQQIKEELGKKTKAELEKEFPGWRSGKKKGALVEDAYKQLRDEFLHDSAPRSYSLTTLPGMSFSESIDKIEKDRIEDHINKWTDQEIQEKASARRDKTAKFSKALNNPETLEEFDTFVNFLGEKRLSPEQRRQYETLKTDRHRQTQEAAAERARASRGQIGKTEVQGREASSLFSEIQRTTHAKKGHDLYVVSMAGDRIPRDEFVRLKDRAKQFGGYYSTYRGQGAIPGFQFKSEEEAAKFRSLGDEQRAPKEQATKEQQLEANASRLRGLATKTRDAANEKLNQERQTNTARRARMAAGIEADARKRLQLADTLDRVAEAAGRGELTYLDKVSNRTQIEQLEALTVSAHYARARKENARVSEAMGQPITDESIDYATMPYPGRISSLRGLAMDLRDTPGLKRLSENFFDRVREERGFRSPGEIQDLRSAIAQIEAKTKKNPRLADRVKYDLQELKKELRDYDRLVAMGISDNASLRTALREYVPLRGQVAGETQEQKVRRLERDALSRNRDLGVDFFPTSVGVAKDMADRVDIQPGMKVLEPSAGIGRLADAAKAQGASVDTVELSSELRGVLEAKGYTPKNADFLELEPAESYDRVIMNPPFGQKADIDHVRHAYKFLKPGGKLIAVMGEGAFFRSSAKDKDFRDWLDGLGGTSEKLPEGSFKEAGTGVNTRLVEIEKPRLDSADRPTIYAIPKNAIVRFDARKKKTGAATGTPKPCGRGWVGTKPPGCTRAKKGASNVTKKSAKGKENPPIAPRKYSSIKQAVLNSSKVTKGRKPSEITADFLINAHKRGEFEGNSSEQFSRLLDAARAAGVYKDVQNYAFGEPKPKKKQSQADQPSSNGRKEAKSKPSEWELKERSSKEDRRVKPSEKVTALTRRDPKQKQIRSLDDFEQEVEKEYKELSKQHENVVPIVLIREKLGPRTGEDFDELMRKLQATKRYTMMGGEFFGAGGFSANEVYEGGVNTRMGIRRFHLRKDSTVPQYGRADVMESLQKRRDSAIARTHKPRIYAVRRRPN